jgi:hypothetical protein
MLPALRKGIALIRVSLVPSPARTLADEVGKIPSHVAYARRLGAWLRAPLDLTGARDAVRTALARREAELLATLRHGVYSHPQSPYLALLRNAGIELGDVEAAVREEGVEGALARLYDAGVRITLDELKGRVPITRPGLELPVEAEDFENPLLLVDLRLTGGGTRGPQRSVPIDLRLYTRDAAHLRLFQAAAGLEGRPIGAWRPSLPATPGIYHVLLHAKLGQRTERWFAQLPPYPPRASVRSSGLLGVTVAVANLVGAGIPWPRHVPLECAGEVARWLAGQVSARRRPYLNTTASGAVRVCEAARREGLQIAGTAFRVGGEPYTAARDRVLSSAGCTGFPLLQSNEVGRIGMTCAARRNPDEVHLLLDKLAVLRRDVDARTRRVEGALVLTTLWARAPKLLLNVESDDTAVVDDGRCGCALGELGLTTRLHTIRSWEKLTTEGMTFTAAETVHLVEEVLPARFGGGPTDYQLVEDRSGPISRVLLLVSPRVGAVDTHGVRETALSTLAEGGPGRRFMAESWREAGLPRVERREPYATGRPKILPLHVIEA